jgi:DNA-binding CsgD family transcriptional regulator
MDGQRFDRWTQTLARKLNQEPVAELEASVRPLDDPAPHGAATSSLVSGTCAYRGPTTPASSKNGQSVAQGICGWDHPPTLPANNQDRSPRRPDRSARRRRPDPLSAREQEIAGLIGQGLRDREIATALVLSEHTVHAHVRHLLNKLGLTSRTQIAAWTITHLPDGQRSVPGDQAEP